MFCRHLTRNITSRRCLASRQSLRRHWSTWHHDRKEEELEMSIKPSASSAGGYQCSICSKIFSRNSTLNSHQQKSPWTSWSEEDSEVYLPCLWDVLLFYQGPHQALWHCTWWSTWYYYHKLIILSVNNNHRHRVSQLQHLGTISVLETEGRRKDYKQVHIIVNTYEYQRTYIMAIHCKVALQPYATKQLNTKVAAE